MTRPEPPDELALPPGVVRRLHQVDEHLAALPPWRPAVAAPAARRLEFRPRTTPGTVLALALAVATLVVVVGFGWLARPPSEQAVGQGSIAPATAPPTAAPPSEPAASPTPASPASPSPTPAAAATAEATSSPGSGVTDGLVILRGTSSGWALLEAELNWTCLRKVPVAQPIEGGMVDRVAIVSKTRAGWLTMPDGAQVWLGDDLRAAAVAHGARILAIGAGVDAWVLVGTGPKQIAAELRSAHSPGGRTFWQFGTGFVGTICPTDSPRP